MEKMSKLAVFGAGILCGAGVVALLFCLNSCSVFEPIPTLSVVVNPSSGHPPFWTAVTAVCSEEGGRFTLFEPGRNPVESSEGTFTAAVDRWPWKATVTWADGEGTVVEAAVKVTLENEAPIAHGLGAYPKSYHDRALIVIDLRYMTKGCVSSTGVPEFYTGIEDPDYTEEGYSQLNDGFLYNVYVEDVATGKFESVFSGPDRTLIGREYTACPIFYWFVNYTGDEPLIPYQPWSLLGCPPSPSPPPPSSGQAEKRVHVCIDEWGELYRWIYDIVAQSPGCAL